LKSIYSLFNNIFNFITSLRANGSLGGFTSVGEIKLKKKLLELEKTWVI